MLKLSERMAKAAVAKAQKRADRDANLTIKDGPTICSKLASGRRINRTGLEQMRRAVREFRDGGPRLDQVLANLTPAKRAMYRIAKAELDGEMMGLFEKLTERLPEHVRDDPFAMSWDQWREFAGSVGMNDEQLRDSLRVMLVFRSH